MSKLLPRLIRCKEVMRLTSLSRGHIYFLMDLGQFPQADQVGRESRRMAGRRSRAMGRGAHCAGHIQAPAWTRPATQ